MHIVRLSLTNFRNYSHLELALPHRAVVLRGDNAQGKTNLLEAIYLLATARSHRGAAERELVNWSTPGEGAARIFAAVERGRGGVEVEIAFRGEGFPAPAAHFQKRIRINGIPRRAVDLVGQVNVVLFTCQDIDLIAGSPSLRRRYLDLTNCQIDPRYLRCLQRYNKIILQRNHLLRMIQERRAQADQLDFWDRELAESGAYIILQRRLTVAEIDRLAQPIHRQLAAAEELRIAYVPSIEGEELDSLRHHFEDRLKAVRSREIAYGMSLLGPHRDDLAFVINGVDMNVFGSRGQQRSIALSLKLAEASFIESRTGDHPILLLDDVLSELDAARRCHLLESVASGQQVVITTTDLDRFDTSFLAQAALFEVREGKIEPVRD